MRVAIATWTGRVSPVFDAAEHLLVVDVEDGGEVGRQEVALGDAPVPVRTRRLVELGVNVLICGAISWPLEARVVAAGVQVIPQICGPTEEVLRAFVTGPWTQQAFRMPGCTGRCRRRRRFRGSGGRGFGRGRRAP